MDTALLDGEYWYRNLRETVQLERVTRSLLEQGYRAFVEVGPHPVLSIGVQESVEAVLGEPREALVVGSLRREQGGLERFLLSLGEAWVRGVEVDWGRVFAGSGAGRVGLPTYAFQHERYWIEGRTAGAGDAASIGQASAGHPLLGAAVALADGGGWLFTGRLSRSTHPWLADHAVMGTVLLAGTAFVELALCAAGEVGCDQLAELTLTAPLVLPEQGGVQVQVSVGEPDEAGQRTLSIHSRPEGVAGEDGLSQDGHGHAQAWTRNAIGALAAAGEPPALAERARELAEGAWPPRGADPVQIEDLYDRLAERGFEYGPAFQGLRAVWRRGEEVFAEVALPADESAQAGLFGVHPALLDAALHPAGLGLLGGDGLLGERDRVRVPFSWSGVGLYATGASRARVRLAPAGAEALSLVAIDESGAPLASVRSLTSGPLSLEALLGAQGNHRDSLFGLDWIALPAADAPESAPEGWAVLDCDNDALAAAIGEAGIEVEAHSNLESLGAAVEQGAPVPGVVLVTCGADSADIPGAVHAGARRMLGVLRAWLADERFAESRLAVVTVGAVAASAGEGVPGLADAAVWGLVRSAQSESPGRFALIDLDGETSSWRALPRALAAEEPQLAVREGELLAPRLVRGGASGALAPPTGAAAWRLDLVGEGTLESLALVAAPAATAALEPGQVRLAMRAAGLNFRDVLCALGMYPGEVDIGGEGAGVVLEVGSGVDDLEVGDRVMGLLPGACGPIAVGEQRLLARIPEGWSFAQAASVPVVFLTAYYGLVDLADLQPGESVLIHAAAGGVGMAAVQLARHLGAEVFGTASPGKWGALAELGLDEAHIASSRTLEFRERFLECSGGRGVDVVLDCLAREFVDASLELLPRGGRFVEMGKTDVRDAGEVAAEHADVSYRAFDMLEAGPERIQQMLGELLELFRQGALEPLPIRSWDARRAPQAFRFLSQARHVGKIVLTLPAPIDRDGTALITGGTGGLGALVARHLVVGHGVRSLLLASRRGEQAPGAAQLRGELESLGARVRIAACDVSDRGAVEDLLGLVPGEFPLSAVVHAAGVIDDGVLESLTPERIDRVLAPKVAGAWHLHELTRDLDLEAFVLFSSFAGTLGAPGQGNYAAANAFLDALAAYRGARGLAGVSMAWGLWAQASGLTGQLGEGDQTRIARGGVGALSSREGLELFDAACGGGEALAIPVRLDLAALRAQARAGMAPALLLGLIRAPSSRGRERGGGSLARRLAGMGRAERERSLLDLVRGEAAIVLGHASARAIDARRAFKELGFDSLAAVELRNRLNAIAGLRLPVSLVFDHPTPAALAGHLSSTLAGEGGEVAAAVSSAAVSIASVDEPIAIVGMGCRYPGGVGSARELWELVAGGGDGISAFPEDRGWDVEGLYDPDPDRMGKSYAREGGFIAGAGEFDAGFFQISPREALAMDPQQRQLLEVAWEALEDARIDPLSLRGTQTGVFAGVSSRDYGLNQGPELEGLEGYRSTGSLNSVVSGRVAYTLGLEGPAVTVDTACSSSLVALHLACQALRAGECTLALAGGVTVVATPTVFVEFSRQRALAADGRCKSFAQSADGAGFSEGVGVVLVERLSDALRLSHEVLGVVRGSAVNQDGASNGLTAPNGPSQQRVIAQALANAGLSAGQVDAVEGHGTGTTLGDPIEAQALLATYGRARGERGPLWLGSLKSNIGHTQAAAGVGGVIKMAMAMRHGVLPRTLYVDEPSRQVDWSGGGVALLTEELPWERGDEPRRAGVSSFGISGTNVHMILEEPPRPDLEEPPRSDVVADGAAIAGDPLATGVGGVAGGGGVVPWVLSGRGGDGLRGQAARLREFVAADPELRPADVGLSLAVDRAQFEERAVVVGDEREGLLGGLGGLVGGESAAGVVRGVADVEGDGVVFVFGGQGSQWVGMALELLDSSPLFADRLASCEEALAEHVDWSLRDVLRGVEGAPGLERVDVVQPALFAVMVALAGLWQACGVQPGVVVGHSQGEIAAAHIAGGLSLRDAARLVAVRSRALVGLMGRGGMVSIALPEDEVREWLERWDGAVSVAAVNGSRSVVVSGERKALDGLLGELVDGGVRAREIPVGYASHSAQIEEIRGELLEGCAGVVPVSGAVPFFSTVTGEPMDTALLDGEYWYRNLRETVQFERATRSLLEQGHRAFVEVSPHPVLTVGVQETVEAVLGGVDGGQEGEPRDVLVVGSLRREQGGLERFLLSLGEAWVRGVHVDWGRVFAGSGARRVGLPSYAFQRERYWLAGDGAGAGDVAAAGLGAADHPLLGAMVALAGGEGWLCTGRVSLHTHPWLSDHEVLGSVLLPGTAFVELVLRAGREVECDSLVELTLEAPLVLAQSDAVQLQLSIGEPGDGGSRPVSVYSRPDVHSRSDGSGEDGAPARERAWTRHATGTLAPGRGVAGESGLEWLAAGVWPPAGAEAVAVDDLYDHLAAHGLEYGPVFQGLTAAWRSGGELFAEVSLPEGQEADAGRFGIHPALLDAALHALALGPLGEDDGESTNNGNGAGRGGVRIPFSWGGVRLGATGASRLRVRLSSTDGGAVSLVAVDENDALVASVDSLAVREVSAEQLEDARGARREALFSLEWIPTPTPVSGAPVAAAEWAVLGARDAGLARELEAAGVKVGAAGVRAGIYADLESLGAAVDGGAQPPALVLVDCAGQGLEDGAAGVVGAVHAGVLRTLALLQAWLADERFAAARMVLVTRRAVAVRAGEDVADLPGASLWGLVRSAQSEHPGRFVLLDIDGEQASAAALGAALACDEPQLALRAGDVLAARLARGASSGALVAPAGAETWRLDMGSGGTLESLALVAAPEASRPLRAGEVRVAVRAAGLNFRDLLVTLGLVPLFDPSETLGGEGAGVVLEVGAGVGDLAVGDRVLGMLPGAFGPVAVGDARLLVRVPAGWSFAQAASLPIAFLTAWYGLVDLAGLQAGQALLVHGAAGGVGMAATQLARHLGAEVFATASPGKWDTLRSLGLDREHIASSRTLEFRQRFLKATGGRGVDVVLDSLAREFVDASLELLPRGGRFVELGKTDIRDADEVARAHPGVAYRAFDLPEAGPERIQQMLGEIVALFEQGALQPLPIATWDVRRAPAAFRFFSQARHIGKIVLTLPAVLDPAGTVLIAGGTGGLGGLVARHLVAEHGVRSVVLAGRRGAEAEGAPRLRSDLQDMGARVEIAACDMAERGDVERLLGLVPEERPLSAVVHAAGVLDDGVLESLTPEQVDRVLAPKVAGAWYLHELTQGMDLSAFVLFSSAVGTLGGLGQGNYAAANAFLDGLAAHRRALGLPAVSMAWGLWAQDSAMTGRLDEQDRMRIARSGVGALSARQGLELFDAVRAMDEALVVPVRLDLAALRSQARAGLVPALLRGLVRAPERRPGAGAGGSLARRLAGVPEEERERVLLDLVRGEAAVVLGHASVQAIDEQRAFKELGFDSLTAVELRNRLNIATGLHLPATLLFDYPAPTTLAKHLLGELAGEETGAAAVDAELDRLELALASISADDTRRTRASARLRVLLSRLSDTGIEERVDEDLESVSDEEMFGLIDRELEAS